MIKTVKSHYAMIWFLILRVSEASYNYGYLRLRVRHRITGELRVRFHFRVGVSSQIL